MEVNKDQKSAHDDPAIWAAFAAIGLSAVIAGAAYGLKIAILLGTIGFAGCTYMTVKTFMSEE